jgi:hypothetical protein
MKKIILMIAVIAIAVVGTVVFYACQKGSEELQHESRSIVKTQKNPTGSALIAAARAAGFTIEGGVTYSITYRSGYYYETDINILFGLFTYHSSGCNSGADAICDVTAVKKIGGSVGAIFSPDSSKGLGLIPVVGCNEDFFGGYMSVLGAGIISEKRAIAFWVDITQTSKPEWYSSDVFVLKHPFIIDAKLAYAAHILPENQIIPADKYELHKDGNVCMWFVEIDALCE